MVAETYLIKKKLTGTLHAGRMFTYVTMGLRLIKKGKRILNLPVQESQHLKGAWLPENGGQNEHEFSECCNHLQLKLGSTEGRETVIHWQR